MTPVKGLNMVLAYSDLTSLNEAGKPFRGVPQTPTYSVFAKYTLNRGALRGLGAGVGYKHTGERTGDTTGTFWLPAYDSTDVSLSYTPPKARWNVSLHIMNVFDSDAIRSSVSSTTVSPLPPITYRLTTYYRF